MISAGAHAETLIAEFGITSPHELDVEAIAFDSGMEVVYQELSGCEASLVGYRNRAIATIKPSGVRGRERFSIGHELGHWHLHRGRSFQCRVDDPSSNLSSDRTAEKEADRFASHLLLPGFLFKPRVAQLGQPTFQQLSALAVEFETSLMATALRLAAIDTLPVIVACYRKEGIVWNITAPDIPYRWSLKAKLDEDSFTYDLLHFGKECIRLGKQSADAWFENSDADDYEVWEQCIGSIGGSAIVLLYLQTNMMNAEPDWNVKKRRST